MEKHVDTEQLKAEEKHWHTQTEEFLVAEEELQQKVEQINHLQTENKEQWK